MFGEINDNEDITRKKGVQSVTQLTRVSNGAPQSRQEIRNPNASCESRGVVRLDDGLEIGQKVPILSGPFAETLCRLAHLDDRGRVRVLLEIMGMEVAAQLDRSAIASAA